MDKNGSFKSCHIFSRFVKRKRMSRDCKLACLPPGVALKQYLERTSRCSDMDGFPPASFHGLETWNPAAGDLPDDFGMLCGCSINVDFSFMGGRSCKSIQYSDAPSTHELRPFTTLKWNHHPFVARLGEGILVASKLIESVNIHDTWGPAHQSHRYQRVAHHESGLFSK